MESVLGLDVVQSSIGILKMCFHNYEQYGSSFSSVLATANSRLVRTRHDGIHCVSGIPIGTGSYFDSIQRTVPR